MRVVAAMVIPQEVGQYAYRKGLFVIEQTSEVVQRLIVGVATGDRSEKMAQQLWHSLPDDNASLVI